MDRKMLIIANLHSGKRKIRNTLSVAVDRFCAAGYIPTVRTTQARNDAEKIVAEKSDDYELVVCCGGDGTLNETISGMMRSNKRVPIGYIPCGSTNDMANTLDLPRKVDKAAELIINGEPVDHDIGKFGDSRYFTYIASFGAFTRASYATSQRVKNVLGHAAYLLAGVKEAFRIRANHFKVTYDGQTVEGDFIFGSISNSTSFGGVLSFPESAVTLNDGVMELMLIRKPKNPFALFSTINALLRKKFDNKNLVFAHTGNVKFESDKELYWTIDGEQSDKIKEVVVDDVPCTVQIMRRKK